MATRAGPTSLWRETMRAGIARSGALLSAALLFAAMLLIAVALFSYHATDPSLDTAAGGPARNLLGNVGAGIADLLLALFGWPVVGLLPVGLIVAGRLWRDIAIGRWRRMLLGGFIGMVLVDAALGFVNHSAVASLPSGYGGLVGLGLASGARALLGLADNPQVSFWGAVALGVIAGVGGLVVWARSLVIDSPAPRLRLPSPRRDDAAATRPARGDVAETEDEPEEPRRLAMPRAAAQPDDRSPPVISDRPAAPAAAKAKPRQTSLALHDTYALPSIDLLKQAPPSSAGPVDKLALDRNAQLLMSVLNDFKVDGKITAVRPGPVVTMYELEPAPGIKASRVIALADDIARNMSAVSARVATISGRNVIGIELPNQRREMVNLHELISSDSFEDQSASLPLVLGKNIAGDAVIADLAPMPHLLVAGTTGSGKSVGLNCMILSLLYRLNPEQCKLIMIDPKMLELSIYDGIPHLLSPVVTDPPKAVRALKWAVEQMEERYRMMASVNVRGLASFNDKVIAARAKGQPLGRKVQTGYDSDTGQPIYEEEQLDFQPLPKIVVVVDELADLMMTAGKEVEFLIQRLAQKARAAGIHLIMATQRPSVDVITGVIKANLPTRISFHVTSKIDSRTILGEQGAEQLLGKGDMLFMAGGKAISRVHGPFVSDEEVQAVADYWRSQGAPDYISSVTEEPEEGFVFDGQPTGDDSPEDQQYRQAIQIVCESQKASTSWLQRQLRIGYNSAARIVERMEKDGIVSRPDHVGRREVLRDAEGNPV